MYDVFRSVRERVIWVSPFSLFQHLALFNQSIYNSWEITRHLGYIWIAISMDSKVLLIFGLIVAIWQRTWFLTLLTEWCRIIIRRGDRRGWGYGRIAAEGKIYAPRRRPRIPLATMTAIRARSWTNLTSLCVLHSPATGEDRDILGSSVVVVRREFT